VEGSKNDAIRLAALDIVHIVGIIIVGMVGVQTSTDKRG
jgi:hypothetical protein